MNSLLLQILNRLNKLCELNGVLETSPEKSYNNENIYSRKEREPTMCALNCIAKRAADNVDGDDASMYGN